MVTRLKRKSRKGFSGTPKPMEAVSVSAREALRSAMLDSRFFDRRQTTTQGKDLLSSTISADKLGDLLVESRPYGKLAIGAGVGSLASGIAAYKISSKSKQVKVLLTALSVIAGGSSLYCAYKWNKTRNLEVGAGVSEKRLLRNTNWLQGLLADPELFPRVDGARVESYMKYNRTSDLYHGTTKFVNFDTRQEQKKDTITGEGVDITYENYPDWVDKSKITVGQKEFNKNIHNYIVSQYATLPQERWESLDIEGFKYSIEDESIGRINNFGLLNRDAWLTYKDVNFFSCANPIIKDGLPTFYHLKLGELWATARRGEQVEFKDRYINADNYNDWRKLSDVPANAIIIGSRLSLWNGDYPINYVKQKWSEYSGLTYDQIFSGNAGTSLVFDNILGLRPDLWYFSRPGFPASISNGLFSSFSAPAFMPNVEDFFKSGLFQPFMLNCRFLCFSKQELVRMMEQIRYVLSPLPSMAAQTIRIVSIVLSVVASLVTTIVSFGSASAPAWASTVSVILMALQTGISLAAKYLESGPAAFVGGLMDGISGLWEGVRKSFDDTNFSLGIHFDSSALVFVDKIKDVVHKTIAPTETHMNVIANTLGLVGNNIVSEWGIVYRKLSSLIPDFPDLSETQRQLIQDSIFNNPGLADTNTRFMETKITAENAIKNKIAEVNQTLTAVGKDVTRLAILY